MPLTPFHLGPTLFFGLLFFSYIDFLTFLVANVIVDFEPILVLMFNLDYLRHGFFHSFVGGTLVAVFLTVVMYRIRGLFSPILLFFKLEQKSSWKSILLASVAGVYMHILLDSLMHRDIQPFYPSDFNPFLRSSTLAGLEVYTVCLWFFVVGIIIYGIKLFLIWKKEKSSYLRMN